MSNPVQFYRSTLTPAAYHGRGVRPPFFEGWYVKLVDPHRRHPLTVIPGVYHAVEPSRSHAFIQIMDGLTGESRYETFSFSDFQASADRFDVRIGRSRFSERGIELDLQALRGRVEFGLLQPWPVSLLSPGIMGWYAWVPFMECYHGVVSLDHGLIGSLERGGEVLDFTGGRGYLEKDWGRAFPRAWIWMQSNHFDIPGVCLTGSIAVIPWLGRSFNGFIIGLLYQGRLYRFATYTGARIESLQITAESIQWVVSGSGHRLEMLASRAAGGILRAPTVVEMDRRIQETLNASVEVRLLAVSRGREKLLFHGTGRVAGLEAVGEVDQLLPASR